MRLLTPKQNQVLKFVQASYGGEWFRLTHEVGNTFVQQFGQGDIWKILDNLAGKGITERENRKIDSESNGIISHHFETWYRLTYTGKYQIIGRTKEYEKKTGPVKSTDPRKTTIVREMKKRSGGTRVTCLKETKTHFVGHPMKRIVSDNRGGYHWENLPEIRIEKTDFKFEGES